MTVRTHLRLLNLFYFCTNLNFLSPIAILFFEHVTKSFALASAVFSVVMISSALLEIPTGVISDKVGRKQTIVYGSLCLILALVFYSFGVNFWFLVIGAIFQGASQAFFSGNNDAYLLNILESEGLGGQYAHYRGKLETYFITSASIAAVISGLLISISYNLLIWISLIPAIISLIIALNLSRTFLDNSKSMSTYSHIKEAFFLLSNNPDLRFLGISSIFKKSFSLTAYQFKPAAYSLFWPLWAVGLARAFSEWIAVPGTYLSGKIIEKFGAFKVLLVCNFYAWLTNFLGPLLNNFFSPGIISISTALWGPGEIAGNSLLQKEFSEQQRATLGSLISFASSILFGIIAFLVGLFADFYGPIKALLLIQVLILPTLLFDWKLYQRNK